MKYIKHLLGRIGLITVSDARESYKKCTEVGYNVAMLEVMDEMQAWYGRPASEWAEHMYGFVSDRLHQSIE